jgi:hypothetical protein
VFVESIHSAFNAAAADRDALPALIAHLHGVTAAMEALAERAPEPDPEGGDAGNPRRVGRVR